MLRWIPAVLAVAATIVALPGPVPAQRDVNPFFDHPWEPWGSCAMEGDLPHTCTFRAESCDATGCGAELSAFTSAVDRWIEEQYDCGRRHCPSWTLRLRGPIPLRADEWWEHTADRVRIDCHAAQLRMSGPVPTRTLSGITLRPGRRDYPLADARSKLKPADILLGPDGWQVPVRSVTDAGFALGWAWQGPEVESPLVSYGRVVRLGGENNTFADVCPVYAVYGTHWKRGQRDVPLTVIETPGWDLESGFCPESFDHPGDYLTAITSADPGGGTNGTRVLCMGSTGMQHEHAKLVAEGTHVGGAAILALGNTVDMRGLRRQMGSTLRLAIVVGGHKVELRGASEGNGQLLWCPQGCASVAIDGLMNHQNNPGVPRDLPWVDLGTAVIRSHVRITSPFWFFQWGDANARRLLVRGRGEPAYLQLEGVVRNVDRKQFESGALFDLPAGSVVNARGLYCDSCEDATRPLGEIAP